MLHTQAQEDVWREEECRCFRERREEEEPEVEMKRGNRKEERRRGKRMKIRAVMETERHRWMT